MILYSSDYTAPFDDSKMKYNLVKHYYIPELDHIYYQTGLNLSIIWQDIDNAKWYLDRIAEVANIYILKSRDVKLHTRLMHYLSHSKFARETLDRLFVDMVQYNHEDGGFLIAYQTGVNLHEMKDIVIKIEHALSVVGQQHLKNMGLTQRYDNINRNDFVYFDDLDELLQSLVDNEYLTEEDIEDIEDISEIPSNYQYRTFINTKGQFVFEDLRTFEKAMETYGVDW